MTMFGLRVDAAKQLGRTFKARLSWRAFSCTGLTTQKRYDCSAAFPCTEVLRTNSTSARLYLLNVLYWRTLVRSDRGDFTRHCGYLGSVCAWYFCSNIMTHMH